MKVTRLPEHMPGQMTKEVFVLKKSDERMNFSLNESVFRNYLIKFTKKDGIIIFFLKTNNSKESYHNSKPIKLGNYPMGEGGGLGFYLGFPNSEVGKWFLLGGSKSTR